MRRGAVVAALALVFASGHAAAQEKKANEQKSDDLELYRRLSAPRSGYARLFVATAVGRGLRFNNPFRLETQLGSDAESVSLTPTYWDAALGVAFGDADGFQHGATTHLAVAVEGVPQQAVSLSYILLYRGDTPFMGYARLGVSLITQPDVNAGPELALGGAWFFTGALGITAELAGDIYYGAGTYDIEITTVPVLSLQLGVMVDYEVLP
jgi:hypothetical protein